MNRRQAAKALKPVDRIKYWNIVVGDDVKVITGPYKGKVGKVQEVIKDENKIIVSGVNVLKKMLPRFLVEATGSESQRIEYPGPIHYSNVQLVGDLPTAANPTGPKRRVEIKRVNRGRTFYNKDKNYLTWRRWVPGENVFLPWPRNSETKPDGPMDTKEADVSVNTYLESLRQSPVPQGMQDELRNKYSKFRRGERAIAIDEVEGLELDSSTEHAQQSSLAETTEDVSIAKTKSTRPGKVPGPIAGLTPETIAILAEAMSKQADSTNTSSVR